MPPTKKDPAGPRRWLVQAGLPLLAGAALLAGLCLLGDRALHQLRRSGRYRVAFADIACTPPPGLARADFLAEVQYLGNLPDKLDPFDRDLPRRLNEAFAGHPWVAEVRRVELTPAKEIRVDLLYREPVLSVRLPGACRAVDREGVLLPVVAAQAGLPRLTGPVGAPTGGPGHPWGDANVEAAARTVALLGPHRDRLPLADCSVTAGPGGIVLRGPRWRIVWGSPPGSEKVGEPSAEAKVRWLLRQADLAGHEYDLRRLAP
jgi:hypothetical protein